MLKTGYLQYTDQPGRYMINQANILANALTCRASSCGDVARNAAGHTPTGAAWEGMPPQRRPGGETGRTEQCGQSRRTLSKHGRRLGGRCRSQASFPIVPARSASISRHAVPPQSPRRFPPRAPRAMRQMRRCRRGPLGVPAGCATERQRGGGPLRHRQRTCAAADRGLCRSGPRHEIAGRIAPAMMSRRR